MRRDAARLGGAGALRCGVICRRRGASWVNGGCSQLVRAYAQVVPDGCAWTLESGVLALTLEKADARPWATLALELTKA